MAGKRKARSNSEDVTPPCKKLKPSDEKTAPPSLHPALPLNPLTERTPRRITRAMTKFAKADPSRQQVLATTELLEHIISFLPPCEILTRKHVSKFWADTIDNSPTIKTRLWLKLQRGGGEPIVPREYVQGSIIDQMRSSIPLYEASFKIITLHPRSVFNPGQWRISRGWIETIELYPYDSDLDTAKAHQSWEGMYIADRPITVVLVIVILPSGGMIFATVREKAGLKFGMVADIADRMVRSCSRPVWPDRHRVWVVYGRSR